MRWVLGSVYVVGGALTYLLVVGDGKRRGWGLAYAALWPYTLVAVLVRPRFYRETFPGGFPRRRRG